MVWKDFDGPTKWTVATIAVSICLAVAGLVYGLVVAFSGTPLSDDLTYSDEFGPDVTVHPGLDPGDSPTTGYPVHPYSILHLWVNATGGVNVIVNDSVGQVIYDGSTPLNLSYFAVAGGYYEVTLLPMESNVTVMQTLIVERLPAPASQSELNALRVGTLISLTLLAVAFLVSVLSIAYHLATIGRRPKGP